MAIENEIQSNYFTPKRTPSKNTLIYCFYILRYFDGCFTQFVVFKTLSYCFEETIGFDVKALFAGRPMSRLIKPDDITKEF